VEEGGFPRVKVGLEGLDAVKGEGRGNPGALPKPEDTPPNDITVL
jgi:hypothetical protein